MPEPTLAEIEARTGHRLRAPEANVGGQGVCYICGALCSRQWWRPRQMCFICDRRQQRLILADLRDRDGFVERMQRQQRVLIRRALSLPEERRDRWLSRW